VGEKRWGEKVRGRKGVRLSAGINRHAVEDERALQVVARTAGFAVRVISLAMILQTVVV
jgi:uncharacterized membrane protein